MVIKRYFSYIYNLIETLTNLTYRESLRMGKVKNRHNDLRTLMLSRDQKEFYNVISSAIIPVSR